jgi:hypothetical protein
LFTSTPTDNATITVATTKKENSGTEGEGAMLDEGDVLVEGDVSVGVGLLVGEVADNVDVGLVVGEGVGLETVGFSEKIMVPSS